MAAGACRAYSSDCLFSIPAQLIEEYTGTVNPPKPCLYLTEASLKPTGLLEDSRFTNLEKAKD